MLFNIFEILDIILMTAVIGFIFHDTFRKPVTHEDDIVEHYRQKKRGPFGIELHDFLWACALVGPTIILHELGHKFAALGFGLTATFHASCSTAYMASGGFLDFYCGLTLLSIFFKIINFGFIFFVPGYVAIGGGGTHLQYALAALAGPFIHLIFWLGAAAILKNKKYVRKLPERRRLYWFFFKQINMFLFILNMIPIPGFDGFGFFYHLFKMFF